eukprot:RCo039142
MAFASSPTQSRSPFGHSRKKDRDEGGSAMRTTNLEELLQVKDRTLLTYLAKGERHVRALEKKVTALQLNLAKTQIELERKDEDVQQYAQTLELLNKVMLSYHVGETAEAADHLSWAAQARNAVRAQISAREDTSSEKWPKKHLEKLEKEKAGILLGMQVFQLEEQLRRQEAKEEVMLTRMVELQATVNALADTLQDLNNPKEAAGPMLFDEKLRQHRIGIERVLENSAAAGTRPVDQLMEGPFGDLRNTWGKVGQLQAQILSEQNQRIESVAETKSQLEKLRQQALASMKEIAEHEGTITNLKTTLTQVARDRQLLHATLQSKHAKLEQVEKEVALLREEREQSHKEVAQKIAKLRQQADEQKEANKKALMELSAELVKARGEASESAEERAKRLLEQERR